MSRFVVICLATSAVLAVVAFFWMRPGVDSMAAVFLADVHDRNWSDAFRFMSRAERDQLALTQPEFVQFFNALASREWPSRDHYHMEEIVPVVPSNAAVDTSWSQAGTRKYSVSFLRPNGQTDFVTRLEFRHDALGEWHPDVAQFIFSIKRSMPNGHLAQGLLDGLRAVRRQSLDVYPLHQHTDIEELVRVTKNHHGSYLRGSLQPLH